MSWYVFYAKGNYFPQTGAIFNLCDDTTMLLTETAYWESNVIQRMSPRTHVS